MKSRDEEREQRHQQEADRHEHRDPLSREPGAHPLGVASGTTGGAIGGAAIGAAVGGPFGAAIGGAVGALAGAYAGKGVAETLDPTEEEEYWRCNFKNRPYYQSGCPYERYSTAYRYGWEAGSSERNRGKSFEEAEPELERNWESYRGSRSMVEWPVAREAARDSYSRVQESRPHGMTFATEPGASATMWNELAESWPEAKRYIRRRWGSLSDEDIERMEPDRNSIVGTIQTRYGRARWTEEDIERELLAAKLR